MCTQKQVNDEQYQYGNTQLRQSPLRPSIAWLTLIAYIGQPLIVTAQVIANQAAAPNKRPLIDTTANGIPLVQIATPNAAGVSQNQYTQFNVDPAGLILNNSQSTVLTRQAGYVAGNQNLANGAASVILNEVTSTSRSQLNGYIEVAGQQAQVIVANPNGITCNGCGFINTSRGVLTTGTPVIGTSGSLDALRVTGGDIQIGTAGLNAGNIGQLDLIARSVQVNGQLWAGNLNVITGANLVNYNTLGVQIIAGDANKPTVGIDVALLGGMYANKIRLVGTEAGVGVNSLGNLSAQAGDFTLDNQGQITLGGSTSASGNVGINSNTGITNSGTLYSQQAAQLTTTGDINNTGILSAQGNLNLNATNINSTGILGAGIAANGAATQNGTLTLTAANRIDATGQNFAGGNFSLVGAAVNLAHSQTTIGGSAALTATTGDIVNTGGVFQSQGGLVLNATGTVNNDNGILVGGSLTANAAGLSNAQGVLIANTGNLLLNITGTLNNTGGTLASALDTNLTANSVNGSGKIIAGRDASLNMQGNYTNATGNVIQANRNLAITASGTFTNQSTIEAIGNLTLTANSLDNQSAAIINSANTTLNSNIGSITNAGRIEGNAIAITSNAFSNTGAVIGDNIILRANSLTNLNASAIIAGTQSVNLIVQNTLLNQGGATIYSLGDVNIGANLAVDSNGYLTGNAANVTNSSAIIEAGGNLRIGATALVNQRTVVGLQWGPEVLGTYVAGNPRYTPSYSDEQFTSTTTAAGQLLSGASMWLGGGTVTNNYSTISAANTLVSNAVLTNSGAPFRQRMTVTNGTQDNWVYVQTGSHWTVSCGWTGCWPSLVPDYGWVNYPIPYAPASTYTTITGSDVWNNRTAVTSSNVSKSAVVNAVVPVARGATLTVPSNGLFSIHSQPGQPYLVVTDPRFTNYANFVSSNYMLSRLSLDPQQIQMRLGDGFYEQQQVTQQITAGTGRMYVNGYTDAQSQFIALMNSGVDAAKDFNLTVGVALTTAQINSLKHDIVWMVDRSVTLPDGTTGHVLAPQVYLSSVQEGDLKPSGALLAANVININSNSVNNSGTIRADTALSINVNDITNQGGAISSGGSAILVASNDILNLSGNISGANVSLTAGRDISNALTGQNVTRTIGNGVVNGTELNPAAGINATGSLGLNAGRDISIVGAIINAGGDATINAGRNLTVGVLTATNSATANQYAAYDTGVTQHTSSIQTGGNLNLASGNDMHLTSAALNVGKDATLVAGGDLTLDASKNSTSSGYNTGSAIGRFNDETVLGSTLNAGGNVTLVATRLNTAATTQTSDGGSSSGRTDGKGNITLQSTDITAKTGTLTVAADANVNIGTTAENHNAYTESHATGSGLFTHTTLDVRNESWRTDNIGSNLSADSISITSGKNIGVVGSTASAKHNINVAAMGDVNISAATNTYGSDSYRHETTTGLQFGSGGNPYSITDSGPDITTQARTDGTKQSYSRSSFTITSDLAADFGQPSRMASSSTSNSGPSTSSGQAKLNIMAGGNIIASGTDLAANAGNLALTAGGTVALLAGQDTLNQSSSTMIVTNPNFFTKQHHTITDIYASLDYQGSTAQGNSVKVNSGADIVLQASRVTSGAGGINIDAGGDLKLLAAANTTSSTHTETLSTDGFDINFDGSPNGLATRRINNTGQSQTQTNRVTTLTSAGDITTHSGGDTLIEAGKLNAQGSFDLSATGYAATTNADGSTNAGRDGKITFAAVKDSTYTSVADSNNSLAWQNSSGGGDYVETLKLANINAGKGLSLNANGGIVVDIPEVPATPAPAPKRDANGKFIPVVPLTPEQQAAQRQADFDQAIQNLSSQPGQAWIGQLAHDPKVKVQWNQVQTAVQHWNYSHDGLTPEAAAVIVIVVTYFSAGTAGSAAGTMTGAAAGTTTAASAAVSAGLTTLASEASLSLINNKGDLGKTLNDMGKSENVRNVVAAMITAGVIQDYLKTYNLKSFAAKTLTGCATGDMTGSGCQKGATTAAIMAGSTWANYAMRTAMVNDSNTFKGVQDANDPSGKIYSNNTGGGSAGIDGSNDRVAGTRISIKGLQELGTMTPPSTANPLWTFAGNTINPDTKKLYTLTEALTAQGGLTGGSQALLPTFLGMSVTPNSFLDKLLESFAGPHDYLGGRIEGGYDSLGNWKVASDTADNIRGFMAGVNIPLAMPLVIPTLLQQINFDPVAMSNTVRNETTH